MQINILGTKLVLTPDVRGHIEKKMKDLERLVKRFEAKGEVVMHFELARTTRHHKKGEVFYAEATMRLPGEKLRAEYEATDPRTAIDRVKDTLKNEIAKYKDKKVSRKKEIKKVA